MQKAPRFYSFEAVQLIVGGNVINNYGADGGIEYEFDEDNFSLEVGADGYATYSYISNDVMEATITVKETSRAYRLLTAFARGQDANGRLGLPLTLTFLMRCPSTGDVVRSATAVIMAHPAPSKAAEAGEREFRVSLPQAKWTTVYGANNL